ncbi:MAG: 16S rRNA (adenine(1518)-N(6)/adenine(1519)-N(6))-dimethyltransferase RsmA [Candidatus Hermodarchaeota archaeon]
MDFRDVQLILNKLDLKPKKHLGQNFITDVNIVNKIISISDISENDIILEIGPGLGGLTEFLIEKVKKVVAIEIDPKLSKYLLEKFSICDNIEIINGDILEIEIPFHNKVISNIPYKITGPILEKVFFNKNPPHGILTVEQNIATRIFYINNYKNFSRISIGINSFMKPISNYKIPRSSFYPIPKIDLALIKIIPKEKIDPILHEKGSRDFYLDLIAGIMAYKNKNIVNALYLYFKANNLSYSKENILKILRENDFEDKKLFNHEIDEFIELSKVLSSCL